MSVFIKFSIILALGCACVTSFTSEKLYLHSLSHREQHQSYIFFPAQLWESGLVEDARGGRSDMQKSPKARFQLKSGYYYFHKQLIYVCVFVCVCGGGLLVNMKPWLLIIKMSHTLLHICEEADMGLVPTWQADLAPMAFVWHEPKECGPRCGTVGTVLKMAYNVRADCQRQR